MADQNDVLNLVLNNLRDFRAEVNQRLDKLVSQEAFTAEQRRVDDRFKDLADDIASEREARMHAVDNERTARKRYEENEGKRNEKNGVWIRWGVGLAVGIPGAYYAWVLFLSGGAG